MFSVCIMCQIKCKPWPFVISILNEHLSFLVACLVTNGNRVFLKRNQMVLREQSQDGPVTESSYFLGDPPPDPRFLASLGALSLAQPHNCLIELPGPTLGMSLVNLLSVGSVCIY
jgi:hypothetical protein